MGFLADRISTLPEDKLLAIGESAAIFGADLNTPSPTTHKTNICLCLKDPIALLKAIIALDGQVAQLVLISYAQPPEIVNALMEKAGCDALVSDRDDLPSELVSMNLPVPEGLASGDVVTTWLLSTSGTTGIPKLIPHTFASLTRTVAPNRPGITPNWGLVYDPTRFAGMQVVLQALVGGGMLIAPNLARPISQQIAFLKQHGCTNLSATPTLWRRLLMTPNLSDLPLQQITLGGEVVDQHILTVLRKTFSDARITHIYASTEAGVGFAVSDGQAGFPASYLAGGTPAVDMKQVEGVLWLRPKSSGGRRSSESIITDEDGFIRSGDQLRVEGERAYFLGRDNGTINVGGTKIYPEMVEQAILAVENVELVRITSKSSSVAGALVVAEVKAAENADTKQLKDSILKHCRDVLQREAVPAILRFVPDMELNAAGKLIRK